MWKKYSNYKMCSMYNNLLIIQGLLESIDSIISHLQLRKCSTIDLADFLTEDFDEAYVISPNNYDVICGQVGKESPKPCPQLH